MLSRRSVAFVLCLFALSSLSAAVEQPTQAAAQQSLYKRIGGYDTLAALTDDIFGRAVADPQLSRFFKGHSVDTQKHQRQHVVDLLCQAAGGPCLYPGREMKTVHTGLGITESDWQILMKHVQESLTKLKIPQQEAYDFNALIESFKGDVVGR